LPDTRQINLMDREGDFYELFEEPRHKNVELLVRASYNRNMGKGQAKLFDQVRSGKECGRLNICVHRQSSHPKLSKQKEREKREERHVEVAVRYQTIQMHAPITQEHKDKQPTPLSIVHIREESAPEGQNPVEWFLLTTLSINSLEDAIECVRWYRLRWRIEDWHRTLKSGCNVEEIAHRTIDRLKRGIAIKMVIAWRIMLMTLLSRECPELSAEILFSDVEIEVLKNYAKKKGMKSPEQLGETVRLVASLAGYLGRKHDGHQVILNGFAYLQLMCDGYLLAVRGDIE
ncbi:MAG: IS4 family transposase, partial [Mariprofundaceae bacterium]|nr:IS4 family transposase [Mariprofundaceae bacterium]